jgi:hypothetical protein
LSALKNAAAGVGPDKTLAKQVKNIGAAIAANDVKGACKQLKAFVKEVVALASNKAVPAVQASTLVALAKNIEKTLGC